MPLPNGQPTMMEAILAGEQVRMQIGNRDASLGHQGAIESPVDGSIHTSMRSYEQHLKDTGHHIVGDTTETRRKKREKAAEQAKADAEAAPFEWTSQ